MTKTSHMTISKLKYDSLNADVIENMGNLYPIKRLYSKFPFNSAIWNSGAVFYGSRTVDCSSFFQAGHKKGNLSIKYLFITVSLFQLYHYSEIGVLKITYVPVLKDQGFPFATKVFFNQNVESLARNGLESRFLCSNRLPTLL